MVRSFNSIVRWRKSPRHPYWSTIVRRTVGSITNFTFYSNPPALPVSKTFMDIFIFTLYPTAPLSFAFLLVSPISCTRSPLPLPSRINLKLDIYRTCQPLPFVSSTHAVCLRVTPCNMNVLPPPLCRPWPDNIIMMHYVLRFTQDIVHHDDSSRPRVA